VEAHAVYGGIGDSMVIEVPRPTKESGQRSISQDDMYLTRYIPQWGRNTGISAEAWRSLVMNQPIAVISRETLISNMLSLDWKVSAKDSKKQDELQGVVKHYTKLIEKGGDWLGLDYSGLLEWIMTDLLDLPFGGAAEVGRRNDAENGRVIWFKPLDAGTLYPTLNRDYPVMQWHPSMDKVVWFPKHAISRTYMSPRPELMKEGWGLAPPEKVILALEALWRGDKYYANLLLDIPPVGILDLGDMEKGAALEWVESFRNFMDGSNASKIPVLYEHTTKPDFISLGNVPNDIMYDRISTKFAAIVASAYGLSLSDIGLQTASASGETLAGSIRQERRTQRTGIAVAKKKLTAFFNAILPETLEFSFIDYDDEQNTARARARLANATAFGIYIDKGVLDRGEARRQLIRDGMVTISIPEEPPEVEESQGVDETNNQVGMLGDPVAASSGGQGEVRLSSLEIVKSDKFEGEVTEMVRSLSDALSKQIGEASVSLGKEEIDEMIMRSLFDEDEMGVDEMCDKSWEGSSTSITASDGLTEELSAILVNRIAEEVSAFRSNEFLEGKSDELPNPNEILYEVENLVRENGKIVADDFVANLSNEIRQFVGMTTLYMLKGALLDGVTIDSDTPIDYDSVVYRVSEQIVSKFDDIMHTCVNNEIEKLTEEVKNG